jgi:hypothetical protein
MEDLRTNSVPSLSAGVGLLSHYLSGMPVYVNVMATTRQQCRFPKSKRKRIRKKWAKRPDNFKDVPGAYMMPRSMMSFSSCSNEKCLIVHPVIFEKMKDELKRKQEAHERKWR